MLLCTGAAGQEPGKTNHCIDLMLGGGPTIHYMDAFEECEGETLIAGNVSVYVGYHYFFTPYFGFGPGIYGVLPLSNYRKVRSSGYVRYVYNHLIYGGGTAVLSFTVGDLEKRKTALLADIGGGWLFSCALGLYKNGFMMKVVYSLTGFGAYWTGPLGYYAHDSFAHNINILIGYKLRITVYKRDRDGAVME